MVTIYTPLQSLDIKGSAGDPLPTVFKSLASKGTHHLRGQLCLVCAAPGVGKSAFVLTYALRAAVPTLYFSADSDAFTQQSRSASILTGCRWQTAADEIRQGRLSKEAKSALQRIPIRYVYDSPSLDQIELSMEAYEEVYGDFPALVVVDNITDVRSGGSNDEDPFSGLEILMSYLHGMARDTASHVIGLHHVTGAYNDGDKVIPLSGIKGQIGRVPEMVLTLHKVSGQYGDSLRVSTVKNRAGKADPSGINWAALEFIGDSMTIRDYQ